MEQATDRRDQILQYLQPHMEECFQRSCNLLQAEIKHHANVIWERLRNCIYECLKQADILQKQQKKGKLQYLVFSFMQYGIYLDNLEIRVDALDDSFYLDEQESEEYYHPAFLQERYIEDLDYLQKKAGEKYIRLQNYERMDIKKEYVHYYQSILFRMIESLTPMIMESIADSGVLMADGFKIIFGEYMDNAIVLYGEKYEDEIFSDRNG